jgi:hypothetical protein
MYVLSVNVNGETTRTDAYASVVDAADAYATAVETGRPDDTADRYSDGLSLVTGGFVAVEWDVPNTASDAGDGPTESDTFRVSLQYATTDDVESDGIPVTYSRAVVLSDDENDTVALADIIDAVSAEFVAASA